MENNIIQVFYTPAKENYIDAGDIYYDENGNRHVSSIRHGHVEVWRKIFMHIVDSSQRQDSIKKGDHCIMLIRTSTEYGQIIKCASNTNTLRELGWCKILATSSSERISFPENGRIPKITQADIVYIVKNRLTDVKLKPVLSDGFVFVVKQEEEKVQPESINRLLIATQDNGTVMFAVLDNNDFREAIKPALNEHYDCKVEIMSTSEPNNMNERTVEVNVFPDGEDPYTATVTLTPAYLYR